MTAAGRIEADWLQAAPTRAVIRAIEAGGHEALFVGGCVRNALIGAPVSDIDIATDALPERVSALAEAAGLRVAPTGMAHGTVTLVSAGQGFEVTTFRRDVETFGRAARVEFAGTLEEDAQRRDFTMNALYARPDGTVLDPVGGLRDLLARRLRFIGRPEDRIAEDYLRILRFFRFHAWYGDPAGGIDPEGLAACAAHAAGLAKLSAERVGAELLKLLAAPDPAPSVAAMAQAGVLARVLPGADARALGPLVHLEGFVEVEPDPIRRLAALGGEDVAVRLRLSRAQERRLGLLARALAEDEAPALLAFEHGAQTARDAVLLRAALMGRALPETLEAEVRRGAAAQFPLRAADLPGNLEGAAIGDALTRLRQAFKDSDLKAGRTELLALLSRPG